MRIPMCMTSTTSTRTLPEIRRASRTPICTRTLRSGMSMRMRPTCITAIGIEVAIGNGGVSRQSKGPTVHKNF